MSGAEIDTGAGSALRRWGMRSWYLLGIALAISMALTVLGALAGLVVPLVVAVIVAILFVPVVDALTAVMPRSLATSIVLVGLIGLTVAATVVVVEGLVDQTPEIARTIEDAVDRIGEWADEQGWTGSDSEDVVDELDRLWLDALAGFASFIPAVLAGATTFLFGAVVGIFLAFFVLNDWDRLSSWVAGHLGVDDDLGAEIVGDAVWSIRAYFTAVTISGLVSTAVIALAVVLLGLPLAFAIAVITFATSYIPYLGAIIAGAFAVLIALGAGGIEDAVIILVVVLVTQNVIQTVVHAVVTSDRLELHPIVVIGSTLIGGAAFGLVGATIAAPGVAVWLAVSQRLEDRRRFVDDGAAADRAEG